MILIVMGVSGSGKTTVGRLAAERLEWRFLEADDYHPPENVQKMARGEPLDDADRLPWLHALAAELDEARRRGESVVLACSALKRAYRRILGVGRDDVAIVHLAGEREVILERMARRRGHYMPPDLLDSQFEALEPPEGDERALALDVRDPPERLASQAVEWLRGGRTPSAG
jgi:carbohydrate kinase (thermoresistant glucokinase family)